MKRESSTFIGKRVSKQIYEELNDRVIAYIDEIEKNEGHISDRIIQVKALKWAEEMKIENFKASSGWLTKLKKRNGFKNLKTHGEGASAPCKENSDTFYEELMNDIGIYGTEYVYNADETGIFYKIAPTKTIARKHRSGFKILKDRVSALFCCNMSGTDKRTPLIIGLPIKTTLLNNFNYRNYVQYTTQIKLG